MKRTVTLLLVLLVITWTSVAYKISFAQGGGEAYCTGLCDEGYWYHDFIDGPCYPFIVPGIGVIACIPEPHTPNCSVRWNEVPAECAVNEEPTLQACSIEEDSEDVNYPNMKARCELVNIQVVNNEFVAECVCVYEQKGDIQLPETRCTMTPCSN